MTPEDGVITSVNNTYVFVRYGLTGDGQATSPCSGRAVLLTGAGDWHDRYRPGVVRRISATAGRCSLENHQVTTPGPGAPTVPVAIATNDIAAWWGTGCDTAAPEPTEAHLAAADTRHRPGVRR